MKSLLMVLLLTSSVANAMTPACVSFEQSNTVVGIENVATILSMVATFEAKRVEAVKHGQYLVTMQYSDPSISYQLVWAFTEKLRSSGYKVSVNRLQKSFLVSWGK